MCSKLHSFPCYILAMAYWILTKLYGNHQYRKEVHMSLAYSGVTLYHSYGIFNTKADAHILDMFQLDPSTQSYDPCLVMQYVYKFNICFCAISWQRLTGFQRNFMGTVNSEGVVHIIGMLWSDHLTQLWPLDGILFPHYSLQL